MSKPPKDILVPTMMDSVEDIIAYCGRQWVLATMKRAVLLSKRQERVMKDDPGDLKPIREIIISFWCEQCYHEVKVKAILYSLGIADLLEDAPVVCPGCKNDVRWLSEEEHGAVCNTYQPTD